MLKIYVGLPLYDSPANICMGDAYFAQSIPKYGMTLQELAIAVDLPEALDRL